MAEEIAVVASAVVVAASIALFLFVVAVVVIAVVVVVVGVLIITIAVEAVVKLKKAMWGDIDILNDVISKYKNDGNREFEANGDWWGGRWPSDERLTMQWQVDNGDMQERTVNKWERI